MVGVPGRSKGCNTCIQRKIKCDQKAPLCGNCRKSNRLCTGYKRRLGYILSCDVSLLNEVEPGRDESTITYQGRWRKPKSSQLPLSRYQVLEPPSDLVESTPLLSLCRQVSTNTALLQQFHYIFLNDHFPAEMLGKRSSSSAIPMAWLLQLQDTTIQSPALKSSLATYIGARVGRKNNDMNLVYRSRSMYMSGLKQVQEALSNPQTRLSDETLAACMALLLYELTERPVGTPSAYMTHQRGAMMLLQMRGPDASVSPLGHSLFLQLRAQTILGSLIYRRETFLSRPEWLERPWRVIPKTPFDEINDALLNMPAIFQQFDEISKGKPQILLQDSLRDIIAKFLKVESVLLALYENFEKSVSGPLYWSELSAPESYLDKTRLGNVFPVSLHFSAFIVAQFITNYWSAMMAVHNQLMFTYDRLVATESPTELSYATSSPTLQTATESSLYPAGVSALKSREQNNKWKTMARNICQSAEYFLQDEMGEFGPLYMLALLSGCNSCMKAAPEDWSREISWIGEIIEGIKKKSNLPVQNLLEGEI